MPLTKEEKIDIVRYMTECSTKSFFESGILEDTEDKWDLVDEFVAECCAKLESWVQYGV